MTRVGVAVVFKFAFGVVLSAAALCPGVSAQQRQDARSQGAQPPAARPAQARADARDADADLSITARVTADSLRFEKVPNASVEFTGKPGRNTVWEAERENLPQQVQPGVTYRNIGITLRITSVFADIDRIVAEALGEVPVKDEPQPPTPTTAPPSPTSNERSAAAPAPPAAPAASPANAAAATPRRRPARKGRMN